MSFKCIHISDIHFRGLSRHDEYRESFVDFFKKAKELNPDVIYVGGDIVHSKTQGISPELIDILNWWFTSLASIAPTHIILGNHDGLILNKDRQDAITPIVTALDNSNLYLYKKSGTYPTGIDGYNWCVFSCFDEEGWESVKPVPGEINIALFHGGVHGSITDINWNIEGEVSTDFFHGYDFAFLGDIHKLQYLDKEKRIAYPGSTIQQNYGEDPGKGFLYWEIDDKDNFDSTFYEVYHSKPYVTIEWKDNLQSTLDEAEIAPDGARFRVRSSKQIPQAEIKQLHSALKDFKSASEIVFKWDYDTDLGMIQTTNEKIMTEDLRDVKTHFSLMREYYSDSSISEEEWESLDKLCSKFVTEINKDGEVIRNLKFSIKNMKFDNTFSYGKGNVINFDKLSGITGIFGRNRIGKSSIPGTLMYTLFNTTDRGPIKNLHIINSRKGHCVSKVDVSVNGVSYRAERQSVKHQNRRGVVNATTHLNLYKIDSDGNQIQDMSEEQRRETEKVLRRLVGTPEDFLLTSLASQGEMNTFIKHRATKRKEILTNFLDLDIFERMYTLAKDESVTIKASLRSAPSRDWDIVIDEKVRQKIVKSKKRDEVDKELTTLRNRLQSMKISLATHKDKDIVTRADITNQENSLNDLVSTISRKKANRQKLTDSITDLEAKINAIENIKSQFPIQELRTQLAAQQELEKSLVELEHLHEKEKAVLSNQKKSIKKLSDVPCGDAFPTCKYIKESHKNKKLALSQKENVDSILREVRSAKKSLKVLQSENLRQKIQRYDDILSQESIMQVDVSKIRVQLHEIITSISNYENKEEDCRKQLADMQTRVVDDDRSHEITKLKEKMSVISSQISALDAKKLSLSEMIGQLSSDVKKLRSEHKNYKSLIKQWRIYDLFMNAVCKKGIPLQIITSQLPAINNEISKILQGVVGFTVELEAEQNSNAMDIYINYGDSKRVIECGSGMEKLISSMAIRVALINVSSLPKSDILIIDEGFGALDEMNIEACNRLLKSLKKWFKNILIISHVDAVKDTVDNMLDITIKEKNARVTYE